jgi:DNA-binding IclR family transcriptional regulator
VSRLGLLALSTDDLTAMAAEAMQWLCSTAAETVHIAVLDGSEVLNIAQVDGPAIVGIGSWVGRKTSLHCAANGKVLAAYAETDLFKEPLPAFTPRTITSLEVLRSQLAQVRELGWASNIGELEEGLNAVAVPVFDATRSCRAALSVSGPSYRVPPERFPDLAELSRKAARLIGFRLGFGRR